MTKPGSALRGKDKQQAKLRQVLAESQPRPDGPPDFGHMEQQRREADEKFLAVLTADQKSQWTKLIGKPFEFPRPGGMMRAERKLLAKFNQNNDQILDLAERQAAREELESEAPYGHLLVGRASVGHAPAAGARAAR